MEPIFVFVFLVLFLILIMDLVFVYFVVIKESKEKEMEEGNIYLKTILVHVLQTLFGIKHFDVAFVDKIIH